MKKLLLLTVLSSFIFFHITTSHCEEASFPNLDEAVQAGSIECSATYSSWFYVKIELKRKNVFVKGIRIETGIMFESSKGTSTRISVERKDIPFKEDGTAMALIKTLALAKGNFKGEGGEALAISRKRMVLSSQKAYICKEISTNKDYTQESGQIAIWLEGRDPEMGRISRWVIYPAMTPLFSYSDGYKGLYLARESGVDISKKTMLTNTTLFLIGLREENRKFANFSLEMLKKQGYKGDTPVDMAEFIFKKEEFLNVLKAAATLLILNRNQPIIDRIKNGKQDWNSGQLLKMYVNYVPTDEAMKLVRPLLETSFSFACSKIHSFLYKLPDTKETLEFAQFLMDKGAKDDIRKIQIRDIRRRAAGKFYKSKRPNIIAKIMSFMKTDPDWGIRIDSANNLRYKKHKPALAEMKKLLEIIPKGYHSKLESIIKEFEKELNRKNPNDDTPKKPW